jgi:hypothetical protein
MRLKSEMYKKEQILLSNKIIDILELDHNGQIILYNLDNDIDKQKKIMDLIPELRKYFSFGFIRGIESPDVLKRPWLSIIRQITKITHTFTYKDKQITQNNTKIRTRIYTFSKLK